MKVGDLVRVVEPRACGGVKMGTTGIIIKDKMIDRLDPTRHNQWVIMWTPDTGRLYEQWGVTYGHGLEVISESR